MHLEMLKRLKNNPHYKLNAKQQAELDQIEREQMVEFGVIEKHNNTVEKHPVFSKKKARSSK